MKDEEKPPSLHTSQDIEHPADWNNKRYAHLWRSLFVRQFQFIRSPHNLCLRLPADV